MLLIKKYIVDTFCLIPFVTEHNNWWQLKWDLLRTVGDPLEAQAAELGVKKRRGGAVSQLEQQR